MINRSVDAQTHIANTPEAVMRFLADVRNRQQYVDALKEITLLQGGEDPASQQWHWKFAALGMEFEGTARCTGYQAGQMYSFETEGGAQSSWLYRAEPEETGTKLSLHVDYSLPDEVLSHLPPGTDPAALEQAEAAEVFQNLKTILDK